MSKKSLKSLATFLGSGGHIFEGSLFQGPNQGSTNHGQLVSIDKLQVGRYQPRTNIDQDYLSELEDSIRGLGIIQPLIVRPIPSQEGQYEIIVGEMRFRAAQKAGLTEVPVIIRDADDRLAAIIALVENLQRKDLNPIEQAQGINRLMDEFGLTQKEVAKVLGFKNQSTVSKSLGLLKLDPQVQAMILEGRLDAGHA